MASLIKNRILKHLSKFTKNLSADRINVSTLKGEGELTNLELNEEVLTDLLELPVWIRLSKAICNKVSCKIMWTKLKSVPIYLNLDEVLVEMETCEELRQHSSQTVPNYSSGGKYGFSDKVIDGMTVRVNSVVINFKSTAFHASFHLSRLCLDSRTPLWQKSDLRMTRLKEPDLGLLLIFKELEWQTLRVEATAVQLQDKFYTPLRLITNQARCRITIKKRLSDCSVLGSRLVFILDELLWVVTDSQLKAAMHFANSLTGLIQRATQLSQKTKAQRKLETSSDWMSQQTASSSTNRAQQGHTTAVDSVLARVFSTYDVHETSYHFCSGQIDLHLCDEVTPEGLCSSHPQLSEGGAIQVSLHNLSVDYYPYHLAAGSRKYWLRYKENSTSRSSWVSSLLADFRMRLMELLPGESPKTHTPVHRIQGQMDMKRGVAPTKSTINSYLSRLMSVCIIVRMDDFTVFSVSTPSSRSGVPNKCFSSDKGRLLLPQDMSAVHLEFTQYYYPGDSNLSVPPHNIFVQMNPVHFIFDPVTMLWLNAFSLSLQKSQVPQSPSHSSSPKMDIRMEALMPRLVFIDNKEHQNQIDRPRKLQIQISRLTLTNSRIGDSCSRMDLGKCLEVLQGGELFFGTTFPSTPEDPNPVINAFVSHAVSADRSVPSSKDYYEDDKGDIRDIFENIQKELLWQEQKNIWCIHMDPVWADFTGMTPPNKLTKPRPVPFLDAFPLTIWVHQKIKEVQGDPPTDIHVIGHVQSLMNIQMNHYQYLFLMRISEAIAEMGKQLVSDTCRMTGVSLDSCPLSSFAMLIPELDLSFVMGASQENEVEGSLHNCNSMILDEERISNGVKSSISEHLNLKGNSGDARRSEAGLSKSRSDSLLDSRSLPNGSPTESNGEHAAEETAEVGLGIADGRRSSSSDWAQVPENLTRTLASGSTVMKKGFSSLMSSIDSAFSSNRHSLQSLDRKHWSNSPDDGQSAEDWETLSVRSDMSSDSDQFLMVHLDNQTSKLEDTLFSCSNTTPKVEKAAEMKEDSPSTTSSCSIKRLDLVTSLTLRLGKLELIQQSRGHQSVIQILVNQIASEEHGTMTWDEFQTKFSARSRGWQESFSGLSIHPCDIRLRYEVGPTAEKISPTAGERGIARAVISRVSLSLSMSSVIGLPDLFEDEIIPLPMPLRVYLRDICFHFQEDRPPANVTSPGPEPLDVDIQKMSILREADGIFHIKVIDEDVEDFLAKIPSSSSPSLQAKSFPFVTIKQTTNAATITDEYPTSQEQKLVNSLQEENEQLKLKLMVLETLQDENEKLKDAFAMERAKAESAVQRLFEVEEEVAHLQEEKQSLLATRQVLQQELVALETRHDSFTTHNATG